MTVEPALQVFMEMLAAEQRADLDAYLRCFAPDAAVFSAADLHVGLAAVRQDMASILASDPAGLWDVFKILQLQADGELLHVIWEAPPFMPYGAEFFVVRDGQIRIKTYAYHPHSPQGASALFDLASRQQNPLIEMVRRALHAASRGDVDGALGDFSEDALLFTPHGQQRGIVALRVRLHEVGELFWRGFEVMRMSAHDEIVHVIWRSEPAVCFGTSAFVVRDGRLSAMTCAFYAGSR